MNNKKGEIIRKEKKKFTVVDGKAGLLAESACVLDRHFVIQECNAVYVAARYIALGQVPEVRPLRRIRRLDGKAEKYSIEKPLFFPLCILQDVQCYALRLLRFLFSVDRNRRLVWKGIFWRKPVCLAFFFWLTSCTASVGRHFKRLFPPDLFAAFIDIGHYHFDLKLYKPLIAQIAALPKAGRERLRAAIMVGKHVDGMVSLLCASHPTPPSTSKLISKRRPSTKFGTICCWKSWGKAPLAPSIAAGNEMVM